MHDTITSVFYITITSSNNVSCVCITSTHYAYSFHNLQWSALCLTCGGRCV